MMTILHIFVDDKFSKGIFGRYLDDGRTKNTCALINLKNDVLHYLSGYDGLSILTSRKEVKQFFQTTTYDVVFLHSFPVKSWFAIQYIPHDKKIVWWAWGYDIYQLPYGIKPFIKVEQYKPITKRLLKRISLHCIKELFQYPLFPYYSLLRNKVLERIDYFQPVIPLEYKLMKLNKGFNAEEFYYPNSLAFRNLICENVLDHQGNILFGNSAHYTNNHLDVAEYMKKATFDNQIVFIPVSYGVPQYKDRLKKHLQISGVKLTFMEGFLPLVEYYSMVNSCSYFVSGVIRQQSMGNIYYCLLNGIKVFLYKDSLVYKQLISDNCFVYAIEDIEDNSFSKPLTKEEAEHNRACVLNDAKRRDEIWNCFLMQNNNQ